MQQSTTDSVKRDADEQTAFNNYLPGMPAVSEEPGRIERLLKRVFRRRGAFGLRVRRE